MFSLYLNLAYIYSEHVSKHVYTFTDSSETLFYHRPFSKTSSYHSDMPTTLFLTWHLVSLKYYTKPH